MRVPLISAFFAAVLPMSANATEEPDFTVLIQDGAYEVREYAPMIVAEVEVTGNMRRAGNSGFRPLADYIFGNNTTRSEIEMTAPVTRKASTKIEMTAPVTRVENPNDSWTVSFVMPAEWTMETLPRPNNPDVTLREVPGEMIATIKFSGAGSESTHKKKQIQLEGWIAEQGYEAIGAPRYAGYDAPWVPGPFRRNEVMIPVTKRD